MFLPVTSFLAEIEDELNTHGVVWVTAGVGTGKSTLAKYLAEQYEHCVLIKSPADPTSYDAWTESVASAHGPTGDTCRYGKLRRLLTSFAKQNKLLIFDDGHLVNESIRFMARLCKDRMTGTSHPRVLFFSESRKIYSAFPWGHKGPMVSPWDQPRTVEWRPDLPDPQQVANDLKRCHVYLDAASVKFLFDWCGAKHGVMIRALQWVQEYQRLRFVFCAYTYAHTHMHTHTHTHTHTYTYTYTYTHIHIYTYIHIYTHTGTRTCVHIH